MHHVSVIARLIRIAFAFALALALALALLLAHPVQADARAQKLMTLSGGVPEALPEGLSDADARRFTAILKMFYGRLDARLELWSGQPLAPLLAGYLPTRLVETVDTPKLMLLPNPEAARFCPWRMRLEIPDLLPDPIMLKAGHTNWMTLPMTARLSVLHDAGHPNAVAPHRRVAVWTDAGLTMLAPGDPIGQGQIIMAVSDDPIPDMVLSRLAQEHARQRGFDMFLAPRPGGPISCAIDVIRDPDLQWDALTR